jgi:hypothetical protein
LTGCADRDCTTLEVFHGGFAWARHKCVTLIRDFWRIGPTAEGRGGRIARRIYCVRCNAVLLSESNIGVSAPDAGVRDGRIGAARR